MSKMKFYLNEKWRSNVCDLRNLYKVANTLIEYLNLDLSIDLLVGLHVH